MKRKFFEKQLNKNINFASKFVKHLMYCKLKKNQ